MPKDSKRFDVRGRDFGQAGRKISRPIEMVKDARCLMFYQEFKKSEVRTRLVD